MLKMAQLFDVVADDLDRSARIFRDELASDQPHIRELCEHLERYHGKQVRPALLLLSARACGDLRPAHHVLAAVVEMVHMATLVHDDVLDEADVRRQSPTISRRWGPEQAVLLGDYLFSHAFRLCSTLEDQYAARLIGATAVSLCAGELRQVSNCQNYGLSENEYFEIIAGKTASLIGACSLLGAHYAGADEKTVERMHRFGIGLGAGFQIIDDVLDLTGDEKVVGKTLGRDLDKGKLTLPLIHCLKNSDETLRKRMLDVLNNGTPARGGLVGRMLAASDSLDYAARIAREHVQESIDILEHLPPSDARTSLTAMAEFTLTRKQ